MQRVRRDLKKINQACSLLFLGLYALLLSGARRQQRLNRIPAPRVGWKEVRPQGKWNRKVAEKCSETFASKSRNLDLYQQITSKKHGLRVQMSAGDVTNNNWLLEQTKLSFSTLLWALLGWTENTSTTATPCHCISFPSIIFTACMTSPRLENYSPPLLNNSDLKS